MFTCNRSASCSDGCSPLSAYKIKDRITLSYGRSKSTWRQWWTANNTDTLDPPFKAAVQVTLAWVLQQVEDLNGNGMYIDYQDYHEGSVFDNNLESGIAEPLPSAILYTYNKLCMPKKAMVNSEGLILHKQVMIGEEYMIMRSSKINILQLRCKLKIFLTLVTWELRTSFPL